MKQEEHKYKTSINMLKDKKHFKYQIDKLIKEKKDFDAGLSFNSKCNCRKCEKLNKL